MSNNVYFATESVEKIGSEIMERIEGYYDYLQGSGLATMWKNSHDQYFEAKFSNGSLYASGDHGEYMNMSANQYKSLLNHVKVLTTNQRPALKPRAVNTDSKSTAACKLSSSLLDFYMREQKVENELIKSVDLGLRYGESYTAVTWDASGGEDYGINQETNSLMRAGDVRVKTYLPQFVVRDYHNMDSKDNLWYVTIDFVNKFDLAAKYPAMAEEIKNTRLDDTIFLQANMDMNQGYNESEVIAVYSFLHKRSAALIDGRETILLDDQIILSDGPLPYQNCPIFRLAPEESDFNQFGWSPAYDILAIQEGLTGLYSAVLTNQTTFAVQSIMIPSGYNISVDQLTGGLQLIEYDPGLGKPEPLNLTMTNNEVFNFIRQLEQLMQTLIGISDVNRGMVPPNIKSGNALALLASQAIEYNSGLQQSYNMLLEDVGSAIVNTLKDFAKAPRIATIVGSDNSSYLKEFTGDDLQLVNRVQVDVANPLSKTLAGKVQLADSAVERGWITNPQEYDTVLLTGNLDHVMDGGIKKQFLMKDENEAILRGETPIAMVTDQHLKHIAEHSDTMASTEARKDPEIIKASMTHIQEHIDILSNPEYALILQTFGQAPIAPPQPMPGQAPQQPRRGGPQAPPASANISPSNPTTDMAATINEPKMPINPLSGNEFNNEDGGL